MSKHISVATIQSPEFVNLQQMDINPLMSKCEVKVLYIGQNRNGSMISKEVATEMSKTLRGCPIVGYYINNKEDFGDHGDQVIIDGEGIKFNKLTKPYGFIAPDAKVWFQFFEDQDEFGNTCLREYLMTEGYLWTGQFEECKRVIEDGNPQSMELDEATLDGHWATDNEKQMDFFIINDATFSKLCILGEDVEPCFEGASISAPEISSEFSKDDNFMKSLFTMMKELEFALNNSKGGLSMAELDTSVVAEEPVVETETEVAVEETVENFSAEEGKSVEETPAEIDIPVEEFAKADDEDKKESDDAEEEKSEEEVKDEEEKEDKKDYSLIESELEELQNKYSLLEEENKALRAFKLDIENKQKDDLISSFYMLSDEDKKEVIENKALYSLDDIEAKLSVICVRKKVNFNLDNEEAEEKPATVFNLNAHQEDNLPAWLKAVEDIKKNND